MSQTASSHNDRIVDQFTRQATPFAEKFEHSLPEPMRLVMQAAQPTAADTALDVACGPGLLVETFAPRVAHVTGVDLTPAMIDLAQKRLAEKNQTNVDWRIADAGALPFADESFSIVYTRYSFHHFLHPAAVLAEMARVCRPGGRVVVIDVYTTSTAQQAAYDRIEKLRDPSHVSALQLTYLRQIFAAAQIAPVRESFYRLDMDLESQLAASFPEPGSIEEIRRLSRDDIGKNQTGFEPRFVDGALRFSYPVAILAGRK